LKNGTDKLSQSCALDPAVTGEGFSAILFSVEKKGDSASFDPVPFREGLRKRNARYRQALEYRIQEARAFLPTLVNAFLSIDPDIEKIVLFGSLARGEPRTLEFDIDLAVRSKKYLKLVSWTLDQKWKIDLVDLDELSDTLLADVEKTGVILYEKSGS